MTSPQPIGCYSLDDRYVRTAGTVHLTGVQALVRAFRDRAILDRTRGRHTATFVAGYEGSPLAGLDLEIARQRGALDGFDIVHRPAVNEELAATSVIRNHRRVHRDRAEPYCAGPPDGFGGCWRGDRCLEPVVSWPPLA